MTANTIVLLKTDTGDNAGYEGIVRNAGFDILIEPILTPAYLDADYQAIQTGSVLIFTSAHAVHALARQYLARAHKVFAVGQNTAQIAKDYGFMDIETAQGDALDLAALLIEKAADLRLTHLVYVRAEVVSHDLRVILAEKNLKITEIIAYRTVEAEKLSIKLLHALDNRVVRGVLFFSARGAACFVNLVQQYGRESRMKGVKALCIGPSVVQSVSVLPFDAVQVAPVPDRDGMKSLIDAMIP